MNSTSLPLLSFWRRASRILFSTQPRLCVSRFPADDPSSSIHVYVNSTNERYSYRVEIRDRKISHAIFSAITHAYDRGKGRSRSSFTFSRALRAIGFFARARARAKLDDLLLMNGGPDFRRKPLIIEPCRLPRNRARSTGDPTETVVTSFPTANYNLRALHYFPSLVSRAP